MNRTHNLKTVQPYFDRVWEGTKTFEIRKNDRDYQAGDNVLLQEYDPMKKTYSGREVLATIMYVLYNYDAVDPDYVVFSICIDEWIGGLK